MSARDRLPAALDLLVVLAMLALLYRWGLAHRFWRDYLFEARPAVDRLSRGDEHGFLALSPVPYFGSMVLRAPFMALGGALGGWAGAYRLGSVACMAAVGALALVLVGHLRAHGRRSAVRWLTIAVVVVSPASAYALKYGHPEEILTAALALGGVLAAMRGRPLASGALIGAAIACKQWGILAAPVAFAVLPAGRLRYGAAATAAALALLAPTQLGSSTGLVHGSAAAANLTFHPEQIWRAMGQYWMRPAGGSHSSVLVPAPTDFVARASHPLIVALAVALSLVWWARRRRLQPTDVLLLLAGVMLLRCVLDPWNTVYYHVPFLLALCAWEVCARRTIPVLALAAGALDWTAFQSVDLTAGADSACLFYLGWSLPACALMLTRSMRLTWPFAGRGRVSTAVATSGPA